MSTWATASAPPSGVLSWTRTVYRPGGGESPSASTPELLREGVPLNVIQRQLGHRNLGVTSIYLQGIDPDEIIQTVHARRRPMIPASVGLSLQRTS